jgi:hypothetical protein
MTEETETPEDEATGFNPKLSDEERMGLLLNIGSALLPELHKAVDRETTYSELATDAVELASEFLDAVERKMSPDEDS